MKLLLLSGLDGFTGSVAPNDLGSPMFRHAVESFVLISRGESQIALSHGALSILRDFVGNWITFNLMGGDHGA